MATVVSVAEAKTHLSRWMDRALLGEQVTIARNGTPLIELRPVTADSPRFGSGRLDPDPATNSQALDPLPAAELAAWEGSYVSPELGW